MDIRSVTAALNYAASRPATAPDPERTNPSALGVMNDFAANLQESEQIAVTSMTGGIDPHALVQALAQTELAVKRP